MQESTRIKDGYVDLGGQQEATFEDGQLYIRQDLPAMCNQETIELDAQAQMALLKALYERRYSLYMCTTLSLGGNDMPAWIASGKEGNVTRLVDSITSETGESKTDAWQEAKQNAQGFNSQLPERLSRLVQEQDREEK